MKTCRIFFISLWAILFLGHFSISTEENLKTQQPSGMVTIADDRKPSVAGAFYPADKNELGRTIDRYLDQAALPALPEGRVVALIVPHAGYPYSASVAAAAYKALHEGEFETVVLVGPCHRMFFPGASVWKQGVWRTPLGDVPVDQKLASAIAAEEPSFNFSQEAHIGEHSLEVQIPFLQRTLKNFKIVPILVSNASPENTQRLAQAIAKNCRGKNVLLIASTDMSHYYPYDVSEKMDALALNLIAKKDADALWEKTNDQETELCGIAATMTVLKAVGELGETKVQLLKHANSGDATGDKSRVVGYGALAIVSINETMALKKETVYDAKQRAELLGIARRTLEEYTKKGKAPDISTADPALRADRAVFVTLRKKGELRGCIGRLKAEQPLFLAVKDMTIAAASSDTRFKPVLAEELKDIDLEISVLSPMARVKSVDEIKMSENGVMVKNGFHSGVFLPQVAGETGWSREEFLNELCSQKAGLPKNAWKDASTELYVFTAEVFGEVAK